MLPLSMEKLQEIGFEELNFQQLKNEITKNMIRSEKRSASRELDKLNKAYNTMTPTQKMVVDFLSEHKAEVKSDTKISNLDYVVTNCFIAYKILLDENITWDEISSASEEFKNLMSDCMFKPELIAQENKGDFEMTKKVIESMEIKLENRILELLEEGVSQKKAIETLVIEFNKLSKSMIAQAYKSVKTDWNIEKEEKLIQEAPVEENQAAIVPKKAMDEAIEYIFEEDESIKTSKTLGEAKKELAAKSEKVVEENKEEVKGHVKVSSLKVKEMTMVLEGQNGEYKAGKDGVVLVRKNAQIDFKSVEELEKWTSEVKEVFKMVNGVA